MQPTSQLTSSVFALLAAFAPGTHAQQPAATDDPFPPSTALAEGVSPEALAGLSELVQSLVDEDEVVGAELLVIKNGHSILHEAYGWGDREARERMETGSVFCVRSMTKPLIGTAILMLIDDDLIELDDHIAEYLPAFDVEGARDITVEHLLTHTSGLPMSLIVGKDLRGLDGIQAVAALGGGYELDFEPGRAFNYSDQGTDTLTALIEIVSGMTAAEFVRTRVLDPLGMQRSACVMTEDHPLRARALTKYGGRRGDWNPLWSPDEPPLFPFFLGSQGLYSTLKDYARFTDFWLRKGRSRTDRLLSPRLVRKALAPGPHPMGSPTGLPGLRGDYGFLMQLWTGPDPDAKGDDEREVVAFGHTGSDGTHAWVFPEQDAMVFYFTQSRQNATGLRVEEALGELLLGVPYDPAEAAPPLDAYLGYYWEGEGDLYRAIVRDGDALALEILGNAVVPLTYAGDDRWKLPDPSVVLAFDRAETGEVTGYHIGEHQEFRFEPSPELPSAEELAARVAEAYRLDLLETLGPARSSSEFTIEKLGIEGEASTLLVTPGRFRIDTVMGEEVDHLAFDGERVWYSSKSEPVAALEGPRAELARADSPFARFGDWRRWHASLRVIQRLARGDDEIFLVRTGDTSAPARTLYVDWATGRVVREDGMTYLAGAGRIGRRTTFGDFRDVSGMLMPFRSEIEIANPLIGTIVQTITGVELGVELPEGTFALRE